MATHIASPHHSRAKVPSMPQEDIGSVLDRFHKWAGHHARPVRELSYEEAVARARRRSQAEGEPLGPKPVQAASAPMPAPAPPPPIPFPLVKEPPANQPVHKPSRPASAKAAKKVKPASTAKPKQNEKDNAADSAQSKAAPAKPAKKAASRKKAASAAKPRAAQKKSANSPKARTAKAKPSPAQEQVSASRKTRVSPSPKTLATAMDAAPSAPATAASAYAEAQQAANLPEAHPLPEMTFAQVLATQIELPETETAGRSPDQDSEPAAPPAAHPAPAKVFAVAPLPDDAPAVHLTVRLASDERESMRERARDLGVTPSAYVRQCALEVDSLRTELDHALLVQVQMTAELALAREEARTAKSEATLCLSTPRRRDQESDWFQRLRNFVFPRKAKGQAFATHA